MKIIKTEKYSNMDKIKTFNGENYKEIENSFKSLPKKNYEMEMFELTDDTGIALSFDNDLHIKMAFEVRDKFEKHFNIPTNDHILVDFETGETKKADPFHSFIEWED